MRRMKPGAALGGRKAAPMMLWSPVVAGPVTRAARLLGGVVRHGIGSVPVVTGGVPTGFAITAMARGIDREDRDETPMTDIVVLPGEAVAAPDLPTEILPNRAATTGRCKLMVTEGGSRLGAATPSGLMGRPRAAAELGWSRRHGVSQAAA